MVEKDISFTLEQLKTQFETVSLPITLVSMFHVTATVSPLTLFILIGLRWQYVLVTSRDVP